MPGESRLDRYGRYRLPDLETGEDRTWTRVSTLAETLEDQYGLTKWKMRNAVWGVCQRPDLMALAQSADLEEDKHQLDDLCEQGMNAAGSNARSNIGTALHKFAERLDRGEKFRIPKEYQAELDAYQAVKTAGSIQTSPMYIERIILCPAVGVAGTTDRIVRVNGVSVQIADLKTGTDLKYSWGKIAIQLACYAHGDAMWDDRLGEYEPMPSGIDLEHGVVIHVPAGEGRAQLFDVDLKAGWVAAQTAYEVRQWRKNKELSKPIEVKGSLWM